MAWLLVLIGCVIGAALSGANGSLILGLLIGGGIGRVIALFAHLARREGEKILEISQRKKNKAAADVTFRKDEFTSRACDALQFAKEEAAKLNHEFLATEHLLLGLARLRNGMLKDVMRELFIPEYETLVKDVERLSGRGTAQADPKRSTYYSPRVRRVLERAIATCAEFGNGRTDAEHLFASLLQENEGVATRILREQSLDFDDARRLMLDHLNHSFHFGAAV